MNRVEVPSRNMRWLLRLFPSYRRRTVTVVPCTKVTFHDLNWSGGSRTQYSLVRLEDGVVLSLAAWGQLAPWDNPYEGATAAMRAERYRLAHDIFTTMWDNIDEIDTAWRNLDDVPCRARHYRALRNARSRQDRIVRALNRVSV